MNIVDLPFSNTNSGKQTNCPIVAILTLGYFEIFLKYSHL